MARRQAIAWILASCALLSLTSTASKALGPAVDAWQLAFARSAIGLLVVLPVVHHAGWASVLTHHPRLHVERALFLTAAMYCGFYGFIHLPLADATGLYFARPLFIVALSALWLRHAVGWRRWAAVACGFAGMLIVVRPGAQGLRVEALVSAAGALLIAVALIQVRLMQRTERDMAILFYSNLLGLLFTAVPAALWWQPLAGTQWLLLLAAGLCGVASQACMVQAYRRAEPQALAPVEYVQIPFTVALAWALFGEVPLPVSALGIVLIAGAGLYATRLGGGAAVAMPHPEPVSRTKPHRGHEP